MKKKRYAFLDFEIDKLTDSIINAISGDSFPTDIALLNKDDLKNVNKTKGWLFNWQFELRQNDREVYKLSVVNNALVIQGIISVSVKADMFICT